ncbi:S-layer homology domain-containing protein [Nitriliruptoraceae bacterium ZYF776]|nr:S-layer homology domain-containing protein [Profundirhabdus halotolerans]
MRVGRGVTVLVATAVLATSAVAAAASETAQDGPTVTVAPASAPQGAEVTVSGSCGDEVPAGWRARVALEQMVTVPAASANTRATAERPGGSTWVDLAVATDGTFGGGLVIPPDAAPDGSSPYGHVSSSIAVTCAPASGRGGVTTSTPFEVLAASPPLPANEVTVTAGVVPPGGVVRLAGRASLGVDHHPTRGWVSLHRDGARGTTPGHELAFDLAGDGEVATSVQLPADLRPGAYRVEVRFRSGAQTFLVEAVPSELIVSGPSFGDVPAASPHAASIRALADRGVTVGCAPGRFCPDEPITRAQFASTLARALDVSSTRRPFRDVAAGDVHATAIAGLAERDVVRGCAPRRFCPTRTVLRDQSVAMVVRAAMVGDEPRGARFDDVAAGSVHDDALRLARHRGITEGCAPDRFCPRRPVTRAQAASLLARAYHWEPLTSAR